MEMVIYETVFVDKQWGQIHQTILCLYDGM